MRVWAWQESAEPALALRLVLRERAPWTTPVASPAPSVSPYYVLNMADEFDRAVIAPSPRATGDGRTPVPCVACNTDLKVRLAARRARGVGRRRRRDRSLRARRPAIPPPGRWPCGARAICARISPTSSGRSRRRSSRPRAFRSASSPRTRCASTRGGSAWSTADKPESQEICFVPDGDYREYLTERDPAMFRPGIDRRRAGRTIGHHDGVAGFTIGQRKGLGPREQPATLRRRPRRRRPIA